MVVNYRGPEKINSLSIASIALPSEMTIRRHNYDENMAGNLCCMELLVIASGVMVGVFLSPWAGVGMGVGCSLALLYGCIVVAIRLEQNSPEKVELLNQLLRSADEEVDRRIAALDQPSIVCGGGTDNIVITREAFEALLRIRAADLGGSVPSPSERTPLLSSAPAPAPASLAPN